MHYMYYMCAMYHLHYILSRFSRATVVRTTNFGIAVSEVSEVSNGGDSRARRAPHTAHKHSQASANENASASASARMHANARAHALHTRAHADAHTHARTHTHPRSTQANSPEKVSSPDKASKVKFKRFDDSNNEHVSTVSMVSKLSLRPARSSRRGWMTTAAIGRGSVWERCSNIVHDGCIVITL